MLRGQWTKLEKCNQCESETLKYKSEFPDTVPPMRIYVCNRGHENIVYMQNPRFESDTVKMPRGGVVEEASGIEIKIRGEEPEF